MTKPPPAYLLGVSTWHLNQTRGARSRTLRGTPSPSKRGSEVTRASAKFWRPTGESCSMAVRCDRASDGFSTTLKTAAREREKVHKLIIIMKKFNRRSSHGSHGSKRHKLAQHALSRGLHAHTYINTVSTTLCKAPAHLLQDLETNYYFEGT